MRAGALKHRVTIESRTQTQSSTGMATDTWSTFAKVFAEIKTVSGNESINADQVQAEQTHIVKIRFCPNITTSMRVNYESRYFDINVIDNVMEHDRTLLLWCREVK